MTRVFGSARNCGNSAFLAKPSHRSLMSTNTLRTNRPINNVALHSTICPYDMVCPLPPDNGQRMDLVLLIQGPEIRMFKAKKFSLVVFATVITIGSATITFGAQTSLNHIDKPSRTAKSSTVKHSLSGRHHRRSSGKRSKRLPNAKSLQKESW